MRSILKLFRANLRHKKGAFFGIVILMMIVTFCYSGTVSNNNNLERAVLQDFSHRKIGDIILTLYDEIPDALTEKLDADSRVTAHFPETGLRLWKKVQADGKESDALSELFCYDSSYQVYNDDITGFAPDGTAPQAGEVFLSYSLYGPEEYALGKTVRIATKNGYDESFRIAGFYQETLRGGFGTGIGLISKTDFDRILNEKSDSAFDAHRNVFPYVSMHINVQEGTDLLKLKKDLSLEEYAYGIEYKSEAIETDMIYATTGTRLVAVFTFLLVLIVMIVIGNSITSAVETDYVNLGVLKSQGFGKWHLRAVWIIQYGTALLVGSILGLLLTIPAIAYLGKIFMNLSGILAENKVALAECSLYALAVFVLCVIFVFFATAKIGRISPVRAISGGSSEVYFDSRLHMPIRKKGLGFFVALRQFTSRRKSYVGSALIVALLVFFLCTVMLFSRGLNKDMFIYPTGDVELTMLSGQFKASEEQKITDMMKKYDADAELLLWTGRNMLLDGEQTLCQLYTREANFDPVLDGRMPQYDNEIMLTELLAERIGKQIGDKVTVEFQGKKGEYVITGLFQSIISPAIGEMTFAAGTKIGVDAPDMGYVIMKDASKKDALTKELNETFGDVMEAVAIEPGEFVQGILDQVDLLMIIIIGAVFVISVIFAMVVVSMICQKSFVRERIDIGIFRAVGFSVGGLRRQFAVRFLLVAVCGSALGAVCSACLSLPLLSVLLRFLGITRFQAPASVWVYLAPALAICAAFFVCSYFSARRVKTVSVRELVTE